MGLPGTDRHTVDVDTVVVDEQRKKAVVIDVAI